MTAATSEKHKASSAKKEEFAVVFELENTLLNGHEILFAVLKETLAGVSIDLTPPLYARYMLGRGVEAGVTRLVRAMTGSTAKAQKQAGKTRNAYIEKLLADAGKPAKGMVALLNEAGEAGGTLGALSCLDEEALAQVADACGLADLGVQPPRQSGDPEHGFDRDSWLDLLKTLRISTARCFALTSQAAACKGALAAGMMTGVVENALTSFQDFSGCDFVRDALDADTRKDILSRLTP